MILNEIQHIIENFMEMLADVKVEIYNEFSFQHELGVYIRQNLEGKDYLIQFERNVSFFNIYKSNTIKKEIDIVIYNKDKTEKYAIELKFPLNGQHPESMYSFIKDIKFCEQLVENGFKSAISLVAVKDKLFYEGTLKEGIYKYFRDNIPISGKINKPTGSTVDHILINGEYIIDWISINNNFRYYSVAIEADKNNNIISIDEAEYKSTEKINNSNKKQVLGNVGIEGVCSYIRDVINRANKENAESIILISGQLHNEIGLSNSMPTVCNAMRRIAKEYPGSIERKPDTVKGKYSSTISVEFKIN